LRRELAVVASADDPVPEKIGFSGVATVTGKLDWSQTRQRFDLPEVPDLVVSEVPDSEPLTPEGSFPPAPASAPL